LEVDEQFGTVQMEGLGTLKIDNRSK